MIVTLILFLSLIIINYFLYKKKKQKQEQLKQLEFDIIDKEENRQLLLKEIDDLQKTLLNEQELSNAAVNNYCEQLDNYLTTVEQDVDKQIADLKISYSKKIEEYDNLIEQKNKQLEQVKKILILAAQQALAEKEKKDQELSYILTLTEKDINDILLLNEIKNKLSQPVILSKLIWSTYIQKPTNSLCLRLTKGKTVSGIYKITNLLTKQVYIGQSVDISTRLKQHIKAGLGIDCSSTNKLYTSMQQDGVYNFKYEILEECLSVELNEKEKKWIDIFQSNIYGLNSNVGVNKK